MKKSFIAFGMLLLLAFAIQLPAQIPRTLSYQGILTDNAGKPRPDGDYQFTFCLYDTATGGAPIWTEQKTLPVKNGLFSTILGDAIPFSAAVKFDKPYWLGIRVGNEVELSPRIPLTSVGYSLYSVHADTALYSLKAESTSESWFTKGDTVFTLKGNVGIGTETPESKLTIYSNDGLTRLSIKGGSTDFSLAGCYHNDLIIGSRQLTAGGVTEAIFSIGYGTGERKFHFGTASQKTMREASFSPKVTIVDNGNVGIGTTTPSAKLHIEDSNNGGKYIANLKKTGNGPGYIGLYGGNGGGRTYLQFDSDDFGIYTSNNSQSSWYHMTINGSTGIMDFNGRTKTKVLEITGGSDLAEPFEISHSDSLPVGSLVVIDPEQPGKLKQATEPYDKRVAGVISGAGGINPGLTLTQEGKLTGSQHVALTGKVYALATAANGAIEPGDLLTTSSIAGYAMKATDQTLWPGAVIGKAMSGLKEGEGLVLVLIQPH